jgi:hypothetical protein
MWKKTYVSVHILHDLRKLSNIFYINFVTAEEDLKINSSLGKD